MSEKGTVIIYDEAFTGMGKSTVGLKLAEYIEKLIKEGKLVVGVRHD